MLSAQAAAKLAASPIHFSRPSRLRASDNHIRLCRRGGGRVEHQNLRSEVRHAHTVVKPRARFNPFRGFGSVLILSHAYLWGAPTGCNVRSKTR